MSFRELFEATCKTYPSKPALFFDTEMITYQELWKLLQTKKKKSPLFFAPTDLETLLQVLHHLIDKESFFPISPRDLDLPRQPIPSDPAHLLLQTSGSTGRGKIVWHKVESFIINALFSHSNLSLAPGDTWLLSLPLYHVGGLSILFRTLLSGAAIALPSATGRVITHASLVPTQLKRYLDSFKSLSPTSLSQQITSSKLPRKNLKCLLVGGATIPEGLCGKAHEEGLPLFLTYGMTEMASQIATERYQQKKGVVFGRPLPHREILVEAGEIFVRGATLMRGYLSEDGSVLKSRGPLFPEDSHLQKSSGLWFPTGDLGEMTPDGLVLRGRKDRMFISGGENIYPEEIEKALLDHPRIACAKVSHRTDAEWGQRPCASVITESHVSIDEILEHLSSRLARFKVPSRDDLSITENKSFIYSGKSAVM